jgi:hypothetical protein
LCTVTISEDEIGALAKQQCRIQFVDSSLTFLYRYCRHVIIMKRMHYAPDSETDEDEDDDVSVPSAEKIRRKQKFLPDYLRQWPELKEFRQVHTLPSRL